MILAIIISASFSLACGEESVACKYGLNYVFPMTCQYHPAPSDLGALIYISIDAISFPCHVMPIDSPVCAVVSVSDTIIKMDQLRTDYWDKRFKQDSQMCKAEFAVLVGDINNDGAVALSEIVNLINGWKANTVPLRTVIEAINNWANTNNPTQAAKSAKTAQKKQLESQLR